MLTSHILCIIYRPLAAWW